MREFRDANIVANEVSMIRAAGDKPVILVEGDTDTRLYRKFMMPGPYVWLIHCDGKPTLIEVMQILRGRGAAKVLGICDADFDRILGRTLPADILQADLHDAEMMIVHSPSFRHVCEELYEETLSDSTFQERRDYLLGVAGKIGSVRMWNNDNHTSLSFKDAWPGNFLTESGGFSENAYISKLIEISAGCQCSFEDILEVMQNRPLGIDDGEWASGHDFASLLDRDVAIRTGRDGYGRDAIEKFLRVSFDVTSFGGTGLVRKLRDWEQREDAELLICELADD